MLSLLFKMLLECLMLFYNFLNSKLPGQESWFYITGLLNSRKF